MKKKIKYKAARGLAEKIQQVLAPGCARLEIAGSIRREKEVIGDIEIVCIPQRAKDLLGQPFGLSALDPILEGLCKEGRLKKGGREGENYKKYLIPSAGGMALDLFITDEKCWPLIYMIRTGSAGFSKRAVTRKCKGGLLNNDCKVEKGRMYQWSQEEERYKKVIIFDEKELFNYYLGGWVEPRMRSWELR